MGQARVDVQRLRFRISALSLILDQSILAFVAVLVNATVYTFISWNLVPRGWLLPWLAAVLVSTAIRMVLKTRWRKNLPSMSGDDVTRVLRGVFINVAISSALWGLMASVLLQSTSDLHFIMTVFMIAGLTSGAVGAYAVNLPLSILNMSLMLGPLVVRLIVDDRWTCLVMAGLAALYWGLMILVARNVHLQTCRAIELGLLNEDLIHRMSDASHEIRTPVSAIAGFAEVIEDFEESTPAVRHYAQVIRRNSGYLRKLVDNILLLSQAESGATNDVQEWVNLREQISAAVEIVSARAQEKDIAITVEVGTAVPDRVRMHALKFQQIMVNLLVNAIKFTEQGHVRVSASLNGADVSVQITDTGIGVTQENLDHIFQPFWRENRSEVKNQEGSGLGLSLSRSLARSMGGDLSLVDSAPNKGSTFELRWPGT